MRTGSRIGSLVAGMLTLVCFALVGLPALTCWLEARFRPDHEGFFHFWSQSVALVPGLPGVWLRRAFYRLVLDESSDTLYMCLGSFFSHRRVRVEGNVYLGAYAIVGAAWLKEGTMIGSRASVLSGSTLHQAGDDGRWSAFDVNKLVSVELGPHAWIGEGAIVMANVGCGAMVAAGSVVSAAVPAYVVVAGNPARFSRSLRTVEQAEAAPC